MKQKTVWKKWAAILLTLVLALAVTACGDGSGDDQGDKGDTKKAATEDSIDTSADDGDASSDTGSSAKGETLEELYESGNAFLTSFAQGVNSGTEEQGGSCEFDGNNVIVTIPVDPSSLGGDTAAAKQAMDEYFADEDIQETMNASLSAIVSATDIEDVSLTYRYTDTDGKTFYEKTFAYEE